MTLSCSLSLCRIYENYGIIKTTSTSTGNYFSSTRRNREYLQKLQKRGNIELFTEFVPDRWKEEAAKVAT